MLFKRRLSQPVDLRPSYLTVNRVNAAFQALNNIVYVVPSQVKPVLQCLVSGRSAVEGRPIGDYFFALFTAGKIYAVTCYVLRVTCYVLRVTCCVYEESFAAALAHPSLHP